MAHNQVTSDINFAGNAPGLTTARNDSSNRAQVIAVAAYFRAEKRGFSPNNDLADWFTAEAEVNRHLDSFSS